MPQSEYAKAGVDYTKLEPFKQQMIKVCRQTLTFPNKRGVFVTQEAHGASFEYRGNLPHIWCSTQEGLGNKNWIAEWMYQFAGTGKTYYDGIGIDTAMMAANDCIAQGALPVIFTDEIAAGDSDWFADEKRSNDLANSFLKACQMAGMALPAGESPSLRYLIKSASPVKSAPSLSGCVVGIIAPPSRRIRNEKLQPGDQIVGVASSGIHANGISLVIKYALELPDKFLTLLSDGKTLGEHILTPTLSYVSLIEALLDEQVDIHSLLPGTGDGVGKIAFDKRPYTYHIDNWIEVPEIFQFLRKIGIQLMDCLKTFNWGIGYYIFLPQKEVSRTIEIGEKAGYRLMHLGRIEKGERKIIFRPENITLLPPGE
jgi:phosphoribosylformylglycinamidine cyclo-ligase